MTHHASALPESRRLDGLWHRLTASLPHGQTLPEDEWRRRHHALLAILWLHVPALTIFAAAEGYSPFHSALHGGAVVVFALLATFGPKNRRFASVAVSLGLISASALLVHTWGGVIEGHFHFFVMIALLALYEDWLPFLIAAAYVVVHHGLMGALDPGGVYNHPDAVAHPWKWAAIHGAFVTAAGIASVAAWRLNEDVRAETRTAYRHARESEERFRSAFHEAPISMTLSGIGPEDAGLFVQVNRALCEFLGYSEEELLGSHFERITHPADKGENKELFGQLLAGTIPSFQLEKRYLRADGRTVWGMLNVSLVRDDQGEPLYAIAQVQDVTERKLAVKAVSESQRQLAEAQKIAQMGSWEWDILSDEVTWSKELYRIFGLDPETWQPSFEGFLERVHGDRERVRAVVEASIASRESFHDEYGVLRPGGELRVVEAHGEVVLGDDGEPVKLIGTAQDVTEQRRVERYREARYAVARELATAKALEDVARQLLETLTSVGEWDRAVLWTVGDDQRELTRVAAWGVDERDADASPGAGAQDAWQTGEPVLAERAAAFPIHGHGLVCGVVEFSSTSLVQVDAGHMELMTAVTAEIGHFVESQRMAKELQLKQQAEREHRARSEFLSRISHELRTPLNAILGFAQVLELGELDVDEKESVKQILKGGTHLLELINEVLEISRVDSGSMSVSVEPVSVDEIVSDALDLVGPLAAQHGVTLENCLNGDGARHVCADQQRLKQVMLNLLSNGIKYNRDGGSVTVSLDDGPDGHVLIAVRDTGKGIPEDKLAHVFSPFDRLGAEQTSIQGTGLGLTLSKLLVEAMGGTLGVESELSVGSTFTVGFPASEAGPAKPTRHETNGAVTQLASREQASATVLYIEDNLSNYSLVERLLAQRPNIAMLAAIDGGLGLELARQHRPDLILLDLHLPIMEGQEVLARLKADEATSDIPVVVVSADANASRVEALLDSGADAFLTKPLDVKRFMAVVDDALGAKVAA
jgi:PAS domain S-box-containing protein